MKVHCPDTGKVGPAVRRCRRLWWSVLLGTLAVVCPRICDARVVLSMRPAIDIPVPTNTGPQSIALADVNGDQLDDILMADPEGDSVDIFLNDPSGEFSPIPD